MANISREHGVFFFFFFLFGPGLENNFVVFGCTKNLSLSLSIYIYIFVKTNKNIQNSVGSGGCGMWWQHGGTRGGRGGEGGIEGYCFLGWGRKLVGGGGVIG